jgi:hypothetical protein
MAAICKTNQERLEAAYRAFRKALGVKTTGRRKWSCFPICSDAPSSLSSSIRNEQCEQIVAEFMDHRFGALPIPTDDIIRMI